MPWKNHEKTFHMIKNQKYFFQLAVISFMALAANQFAQTSPLWFARIPQRLQSLKNLRQPQRDREHPTMAISPGEIKQCVYQLTVEFVETSIPHSIFWKIEDSDHGWFTSSCDFPPMSPGTDAQPDELDGCSYPLGWFGMILDDLDVSILGATPVVSSLTLNTSVALTRASTSPSVSTKRGSNTPTLGRVHWAVGRPFARFRVFCDILCKKIVEHLQGKRRENWCQIFQKNKKNKWYDQIFPKNQPQEHHPSSNSTKLSSAAHCWVVQWHVQGPQAPEPSQMDSPWLPVWLVTYRYKYLI